MNRGLSKPPLAFGHRLPLVSVTLRPADAVEKAGFQVQRSLLGGKIPSLGPTYHNHGRGHSCDRFDYAGRSLARTLPAFPLPGIRAVGSAQMGRWERMSQIAKQNIRGYVLIWIDSPPYRHRSHATA
jgi:hypothetical protein